MAQQHEEPKAGFWSKFWGNLGAQMDADASFTPAVAASQPQPAPVPHVPVAHSAAQPDPEVESLRAELARLKAREREAIPSAAAAFAEAEIVAGRALPAERDGLVAAYTQAAEDDADFPRAGQPTRLARLAERQAARPAHALTAESIPVRAGDDGTLTVVDTPQATRAEGEPQPLTPERYRETLAYTATGRHILAEHGVPATGALSADQRAVVAGLMGARGLAVAR